MKNTRLSESIVQSKLMIYTLDEKNHMLAAPNITNVFWWECDLLSVTRAHLSHEYEIKRTRSDYKADFKKGKHWFLEHPDNRTPNYFWYVTADFEISPPAYAGWIKVVDTGKSIDMWIKKEAPRLHKNKLSEKRLEKIGMACSYRLKNCYRNLYLAKLFRHE